VVLGGAALAVLTLIAPWRPVTRRRASPSPSGPPAPQSAAAAHPPR
jgi:hypothetical protein